MDHTNEFFNAVKFGDADRVKALIAESPALVQRKMSGATALHYAALEGRKAVVDVLLEAGADLNAEDDEFGATPIGWANEKGHTDLVRYLSDAGALVNFHRAAAFGMADLVREYIADGNAPINVVGGFGTPLHEAALWGHPEVARILLNAGAEMNLRNVEGRTALQIAQSQIDNGCKGTPLVGPERRKAIESGCAEIVHILKEAGAK